MRILHLSCFDKAGSGHLNQLSAEANAALRLYNDGTEWVTTVLLSEYTVPLAEFVQPIPRWARRFQLRKLYCWLYLIRNANKFDVVLLRNMSSDPFALFFAPFVKRLITIHHTKEIEEYDTLARGKPIRRFIARFLERHIQPLAMRNLYGVIGVTNEITRYELQRFGQVKFASEYPNGILINSSNNGELAVNSKDPFDSAGTRFIFVASFFRDWHGLDLLLDAVESYYRSYPLDEEIHVDLVGEISSELTNRIDDSPALSEIFTQHGSCTHEELKSLYAKADVAIGSLALSRSNLHEGSTLKVREYLAAGLPIYSGHVDSALPSSFPYYKVEAAGISVSSMKEFAYLTRKATKAQVSSHAAPYIDKLEIMRSLITELQSEF